MTKRLSMALPLLLALVIALALPYAQVTAQEGGTVLAEGFNAPQGILVDPDGNVWVVDSGTGGDTELETTDPTTGETVTATYGETARIVRIDADGNQTDVAMLPSVLAGDEATGGGRLALVDGELYVTSGVWIGDGVENAEPAIENTAAVLRVNEDGTLEEVVGTWGIEKRMNPDNSVYESHPYGIAADEEGNLWVADSGANTLLRINPDSAVLELVTTFPAIPGVFPNPARGGEMLTDPVPTGIAFDDDGNAMVSLLSGAPFVPGSASVVQVTPAGTRTDYATNLTMLTDIRRGPDGEFYAVQFAEFTDQGPTPNSGAIVKIAEGDASEVVVSGLSFPTSIDFDADGNAYITINGAGAPGSGAVVVYEGVGAGETYVAAVATEEATEEATAEPTEEATEEATAEPTEEATAEPTEEATEEPTAEPTEEATEEPTAEPTEEATEEPTAEPTEEATEEATAEPTEEATAEPTEEATAEPTEQATARASAASNVEPAEEATEEPTEEATEEATAEPTAVATEEPTEEATAEPTEEATEEPTAEPTEEATEEATAEPTGEAAGTDVPSVTVEDQESDGSQVIVAEVVALQPGWIVIHADADGKPGPVLGQTAVAEGVTENVIVNLEEPVEPGTLLWAMLHVDEGVQGTYEFPGADVPVQVDDAIVMEPFEIVAPTPTPEPTEEATAEPTAAATEEATGEATAEPTEEATAAPEEEATAEPTEEATAAPEEEATAAPPSLPNTGAALPSVASVLAVVMGVVAALAGAVSIRRRRE